MHTATFLVTTARSGTQWLSAVLGELYPDLLAVTHEPIRYAYAPRRCLRDPAELARLRGVPAVRDHLDRVHDTLQSKSYVEVGFPAFAAAPMLLQEFGDRLRLVHLVRHPVRVAASIVTHRWYQTGARPDIESEVALTPSDPGVVLRHYAAAWSGMHQFQKALFFWAEVHLYGLEVERTFDSVPFIRLSFEDLLADRQARRSLTSFLDLPYRPAFDRAPNESRDEFRQRTTLDIDPRQADELPEVASLAGRFGYRLALDSSRDLRTRYRVPWLTLAKRRLRTALQASRPRGRS